MDFTKPTIEYADIWPLLVVFGVMTAHSVLQAANNGGVEKPYTQYLPSAWPGAFGLILSGFIVNRVARIVVGR